MVETKKSDSDPPAAITTLPPETLALNNDDYSGWNQKTNTTEIGIRLNMVPDAKNDEDSGFWRGSLIK